MIHIAPCSCELHVRIRELEAELAEWKELYDDTLVGDGKRWKARAEKAEAALDEQVRRTDFAVDRQREAEARVAELEEQRLFDSRKYEPEREAD